MLPLLSSILNFGCFVSSILLLFSINTWLSGSGLSDLDNSLGYSNIASLCLSFVFSAASLFIYFYPNDIISLSTSVAVLFLSLYEFHLGLSLIVDPHAFLSMYGRFWFESFNSSELHAINRRFHCCDFYKIGEFRDGYCEYHRAKSCLNALNQALSAPIKATGVTLLGQFAAHAGSSIGLFFNTRRNSKQSQRMTKARPDTA